MKLRSRLELVAEYHIMKRALLVLLAIMFAARTALAVSLPPPENPAASKPKVQPQGPALIPPQNAPANNPAAPAIAGGQPAKKNSGKPPEFFVARRQAQIDRKQAQIDRMKQFKAARAAEQERLYQDWHERYLADTPVRVEYYRALARAYEADAALAYRTPYFYTGPPIFVPVIPVYYYAAPIYPAPIYGTFIAWGW
jgi:hypothetical protein